MDRWIEYNEWNIQLNIIELCSWLLFLIVLKTFKMCLLCRSFILIHFVSLLSVYRLIERDNLSPGFIFLLLTHSLFVATIHLGIPLFWNCCLWITNIILCVLTHAYILLNLHACSMPPGYLKWRLIVMSPWLLFKGVGIMTLTYGYKIMKHTTKHYGAYLKLSIKVSQFWHMNLG